MIKMRHILVVVLVLFAGTLAWSHALLLSAPRVANDPNFVSPKPRDTVDGRKLGSGDVAPCGNNIASAVMPTYTTGQVVKFEWAETIQHPGYYVFQISSDNGVTWADLAEYIDDQNTQVANRANPATWHYYPSAAQANFRVTLPVGLTCANCIVRFIQHMSDVRAPHANNPMHAVDYFSCADIKIADANGQVPPPVVVTPPPVVVPPPGGTGQSSQSSTSTAAKEELPSMNACGFVSTNFNGRGTGTNGLYISLVMSLFFFPLVLVSSFRLQRVTRRRRR
jgi:hypothetical protein